MKSGVSTSKPVLLRNYLLAQWRFKHLRGDSLVQYQNTLARQAVQYAVAHSPYYREHFMGCDLADWQSLPTLDKRAMMADFTAFNTRGVSGEVAMETALRAERDRDFRPMVSGTDLTVGLSSGTSGHRGLFLVGPQERAAWAGALLARALPGPLLRSGGWRVALFHRSGSNLYQSLASRVLSFRFLDLMTPLADAVAGLNAYRPHLLVGPPTLLLLLAAELKAGRLTARPEKVISVAEALEPQDASEIAAAFDVPAVHQIYQCTEGLLAVTCPQGRLHLQEDIVAIQTEALEGAGDGRRVTPIVTDLRRRVQPIIRYRLNDVLILPPENAASCSCGSGFRVIERIEGRCDDVLEFPSLDDPRMMRRFFPDTLRRAVLLADARILDYRVIQEAPGYLRIHLLCPDFDSAVSAVRQSVQNTIAAYDACLLHLDIDDGLPPETAGRKRRRVQKINKSTR